MLKGNNFLLQALIACILFAPIVVSAAVPPPAKTGGVCGTYWDSGTDKFVTCVDDDSKCLLISEAAGKLLPMENLTGFKKGQFGMCLPEPAHTPCGAKSNCASDPNGSTECVTVQSLETKKIGFTCLTKQEAPQKEDAESKCTNSSTCDTNSQCVRIIAYEYNWANGFVAVTRCIPVQKLPAAVLDADKGSCGQNAVCTATQSCVQNVFESTALKSYVCYASQYVSANSCTNIAAPCDMGGGKNGHCMNVLINAKLTPRCVDSIYIPNGPFSASTQTCTKNSDCKKEQGYSYCLTNPVTKKNQCFSQNTILTDMKNPDAMLCGGKPCCTNETLIAKKTLTGCDPAGNESICTQYVEKPSTLVCIYNVGNGSALGTGAGTASEIIQTPNYAAERQERFAPVLEIDIPTVNFTEKIFGDSSGEGTVYSVPYLALYINGIYKYAIGFGALFATVMIIYAGFTYMAAMGNTKTIGGAKEMATNATLGLLLLLSVYTILYTINPDITSMKSFQIMAPKQEVFFVEQSGFDEASDGEEFAKTITSITPGTLPDYKQGAYASTLYLGKNGEQISCADGKTDSLKSSGCGVMAGTAVLNHAGIKITPEEFAAWASKIGAHDSCKSGTNSNVVCKNIEKQFPGYKCTWISGKSGTDPKLVAKKLQEGKPVVFSCHGCNGKTASGADRTYKAHYMVLKGVSADGQQFAVNDPGSKQSGKAMTSLLANELTEGRIVNTYVIEKK